MVRDPILTFRATDFSLVIMLLYSLSTLVPPLPHRLGLTMHLMHASLTNTSNRYRLSCDTRYQLASEPMDERWVGEKPKAHYAWGKPESKMIPMEEARKNWGV